MSKTPKADALRALRERQADQAMTRWSDDKRTVAKRALASVEAKQSKRRKKPIKKRKTR